MVPKSSIFFLSDQALPYPERIKLLRNETEALAAEYANLIKDPNSITPKEHPRCDNHLCDASLYSWRYARNYLETAQELPLDVEDKIEQELEEEFERAQSQREEDEFYNPFGEIEYEY